MAFLAEKPQRSVLWLFPWDLSQIPDASFSSTDTSNIIRSARSDGPCIQAFFNTHKSGPLKTHRAHWVSLLGIEKVSRGDLNTCGRQR